MERGRRGRPVRSGNLTSGVLRACRGPRMLVSAAVALFGGCGVRMIVDDAVGVPVPPVAPFVGDRGRPRLRTGHSGTTLERAPDRTEAEPRRDLGAKHRLRRRFGIIPVSGMREGPLCRKQNQAYRCDARGTPRRSAETRLPGSIDVAAPAFHPAIWPPPPSDFKDKVSPGARMSVWFEPAFPVADGGRSL